MDSQQASETIFAKIIRGEIKAQVVYETDSILAFKDVQPQAPFHVLIIPKKYLQNVSGATNDDIMLLGQLLFAAKEIAAQHNLDAGGYRIVINNGKDAGQTVAHLHLHLLAQRSFAWPPG